ncbi:hypothetical protein WMY93_022071 [Mugilogobius chulae]|uniref:Uncharacterized protein n=1 Tax=Mugilogobius chulae TaxID=88201 RepID=A0AAW0NI55_9GOBI
MPPPLLTRRPSSSNINMDDNKIMAGKVKKPGKRGRKPAKIDLKAKLERSRRVLVNAEPERSCVISIWRN